MEEDVADPTGHREGFDRNVARLRDRRVTGVGYWDVHNCSWEPSRWDYGDWHHAVMGLDLATDGGPVTVTWTNTFHPYGIEVFFEPITRHLVLGRDGPQRVGPDVPGPRAPLMTSPITDAVTYWERFDIGPEIRADGVVGTAARSVDIPTALRLDFTGGSVWFVAAIPQPPGMQAAFVPGDEIMVVFTAAKMRSLGYVDTRFASSRPGLPAEFAAVRSTERPRCADAAAAPVTS